MQLPVYSLQPASFPFKYLNRLSLVYLGLILNITAYIALMLAAQAALGQSPTSKNESVKPTIRTSSVLVIVPTLVESVSGELVANLDADHFRLSDNGIEQNVSVENRLIQPLAVVVRFPERCL